MDKTKKLNIRILQWNAQSIKPKLISFENILVQDKIHIATVAETWLDPDSYLRIKDYVSYRSDRDDGYGGVVIFVHKSIKSRRCTVRNAVSGMDILHVKVFN